MLQLEEGSAKHMRAEACEHTVLVSSCSHPSMQGNRSRTVASSGTAGYYGPNEMVPSADAQDAASKPRLLRLSYRPSMRVQVLGCLELSF